MDLDRAFVASNDPEDGGEPEATACELRGEERVEDARPRFLIHPYPGIGHFEVGVVALRDVAVDIRTTQVFVVCVDEPGRDGDHPAALSDRIRGVDDQVQITWRTCVASPSIAGGRGAKLAPQGPLRYGNLEKWGSHQRRRGLRSMTKGPYE